MSIRFACPICQSELRTGTEQWSCLQCGRVYPCTLGIPSLGGATLQPTSTERELVDRLVVLYETMSIEEMSQARLATGVTSEERRKFYANYHRMLHERGPAFQRMFQRRLQQHGWNDYGRYSALDIGCGIGSGLLALAREFDHVVGLDISLSSLIIAHKVVGQAGLTNVTLIHASAHCLPFLDGTFNFAMSINVLEHIFTPETMLTEVHRVLVSGGVFIGDSRNRFDPFFKEPHVGVRWVGLMPRKWMARYVHWRTGLDYNATHTHLLSWGNLAQGLKKAFGSEWQIVIPDVGAYGASQSARNMVEALNSIRLLRPLLVRLAPSHIALARRT
jgi:ubiquinone/menaquinone biosynthesis C-methylase UbiE/uncharacterized protein YbaR (Trm112 family)